MSSLIADHIWFAYYHGEVDGADVLHTGYYRSPLRNARGHGSPWVCLVSAIPHGA